MFLRCAQSRSMSMLKQQNIPTTKKMEKFRKTGAVKSSLDSKMLRTFEHMKIQMRAANKRDLFLMIF